MTKLKDQLRGFSRWKGCMDSVCVHNHSQMERGKRSISLFSLMLRIMGGILLTGDTGSVLSSQGAWYSVESRIDILLAGTFIP